MATHMNYLVNAIQINTKMYVLVQKKKKKEKKKRKDSNQFVLVQRYKNSFNPGPAEPICPAFGNSVGSNQLAS